MKARWFRYLFVALLAVASRVQAGEAGAPAGQGDAARGPSAPAHVVALSITPSDSLEVEGGSNSGAIAPVVTADPECSCDDRSGSSTTRMATPNDGYAQLVWGGP